ncbi:MAG: DUF4386 domain-containing protein [Anaerolineaceae bacterium]|nr:DUF4386 domain-containing protein [Anaerolineaceae bacterium]
MNPIKKISGFLGAAFLLQAIASVISGPILLDPLIVSGNINKSMTNIVNNALRIRVSIVGEMIAVIGIVVLGFLLYSTLKNQNGNTALVALGLYLITAAIIAVSRIAVFSLLRISQESVTAGHPAYLQSLGKLFYKLQDFGYFLHMLPYTFGATLFYFLFYKSGFLPRALIILGLIAASLAFIGSLFDHLSFVVPMFIFLPNLPFDLGIGVWLMVKGINEVEKPVLKPTL